MQFFNKIKVILYCGKLQTNEANVNTNCNCDIVARPKNLDNVTAITVVNCNSKF